MSFIQHYGYDIQVSMYAEIERLHGDMKFEYLEPTLLAVSKEEIPDKEIIWFDEQLITEKLAVVEANMPRILAIKHGEIQARTCGKCGFCKSNKKLKTMTHYLDLLEVV